MKKPWLEDWPWETVVAINAGLCQEKRALHKPTSDGYKNARHFWEESRLRDLTLQETFEICRRCHRLSPFCFYNGNTFAAIGRTISQKIKLPPIEAHNFRSVVGHYIAGTIGKEELIQTLNNLQ
jgi:hypothetical protein